MARKEKFINFVDNALFSKVDCTEVDPDVMAYWHALKGTGAEGKPTFTDNGKLVMKYLQGLPADTPLMRAKEIAEGMFASSRTISGAMRKLVSDGFVEKAGQDPVLYGLTEIGRNVKIED